MTGDAHDFSQAMEAYNAGNDVLALQLMQQCAEAGNPAAMILAALMHRDGEGTQPNQSKYKYWLARFVSLAEKGDPEAQWQLSCHCRFGNHFPRDISRANYWLEQSAQSGHPEAQHHLAWYLQTGQFDYNIDLERARIWYQKALDQGHPETVYTEALKFFQDGKPTDKAIALLRKAADKNFKPAIDVLRGLTH